MRKICLADVLIPLANLLHLHTGKRHRPLNESLELCRHAISIERKVKQQQIAFKHLGQQGLHIIRMDAGPAIALAGKAAHTELDMFLSDMDDLTAQPPACQRQTPA